KFSINGISAKLPLRFESNLPSNCIQPEHEIAVASDAFNGTLLISLSLLYEYSLSLPVSFDHDRHLLIDNCHVANSVRHGESVQWRTEHDAAATFPDPERSWHRLLLRRPALYSRQGRRHSAPPDERTGLHVVFTVFARRHSNRLQFGIRRQQGSLRYASRGR